MSHATSRQAALLAALGDLQHQPPFADFTVQLKEGPVRTSRILLAAMSPVFKKMALERPAENFHRLEMIQLSRDAWECITQFYLGRDASLSLETVPDVLEVCDWYQMHELREHCGDFLTSCCTFENCLRTWDIARLFGLERPALNAMQVFTSHLQTDYTPEAFLCLRKTALVELLEKGELQATEDDVCLAVLAWMEAHKEDTDSCTEVFRHVKLQNITDNLLVKRVMCHSICGCVPLLQSKVQDEILRRRLYSKPWQIQSVPRRPGRGLLVVGCDASESIYTFLWKYSDKKWMRLRETEHERNESSAAALAGDTIFITGGRTDEKTLCFDLRSRSWSTGSTLAQERGQHGMAVVRGKVYVVGGSNDGTSIEEYSETSGQWIHCGDLRVATCNCGVAALGDTILAVGGEPDESQSLIQTFNVQTRKAATLDVRLPRPMLRARGAVHWNTAFFVGWEGDLVQIREVERSFQMVSYVQLEEFPECRLWYGLHVDDGCVRVIGGDHSDSVECWTWNGQKMENDDVECLPEDFYVYIVGEVDIPP